MTRAEWAVVVSDMVARGAQGSSAELDNVASYLSANFGKDNVSTSYAAPLAPAHNAASVSQVAAEEAPLSGDEISKAKRLIRENGCLSCHRVGETGSYVGPDLDGVERIARRSNCTPRWCPQTKKFSRRTVQCSWSPLTGRR